MPGDDVRFAVISDIHGNRWALEAVLEDADRRSVDALLDLGDSLYGPLDPGGCAAILGARGVASVCGNQDRIILQPPAADDSQTLRYTRACLSREQLRRLASHPTASSPCDGVFCCHGSPRSDEEYLLEGLSSGGVALRPSEEISACLAGLGGGLVLCGHSHLPRTVWLDDGRLVVNPGSVGLPAYTEELPVPYAIETGSPHARYAIVERVAASWRVQHIAVPYDWEAASRTAEGHGRTDWAEWLRTGRASNANTAATPR